MSRIGEDHIFEMVHCGCMSNIMKLLRRRRKKEREKESRMNSNGVWGKTEARNLVSYPWQQHVDPVTISLPYL